MIVYQSPGVYIQEVAAGPQPIAAAPTSVLAVVGTTRRGPFREPTRVTGWADFLAAFGGTVEGGFTAEAVYGFFENGGPAAYVVRVDPSVLANWRVFLEDGVTESFRVEAESPGSWANALGVVVAPDLTAGSGRLYAAEVVVPGAPVNLNAGANTLTVTSVAGLSPGDAVLFVTQGGTREAAVDLVDPDANTITVTATAGAALALPAGAAWLTALVGTASTAVRLATGSGIRRGDIVQFIPASRATRSAFVDTATTVQPGLALTLSAGLGAAMPGVEFGPRVERFTGDVAAPPGGKVLTLGAVVWRDTPPPRSADVVNGFTATASNGMVGRWVNASSRFEFPDNVPAGPVTAEGRLVAHRYAEVVTLVAPTRASLAEQFSFVPTGTKLRLMRAAGAPLELTRDTTTADGWVAGGIDPATQTWNAVEAVPAADSNLGVVVRAAFEPRPGDWIQLGAAAAQRQIATVTRVSSGVYVVKTAVTADASAAGGPYPILAFQQAQVVPQRFSVSVREGGAEVESYRGLALHPDHPSYYFRDEILNAVSTRIRVTERPPAAVTAAVFPAFAKLGTAGSDQPATSADFKRGFTDLERVTEPAMVICPDALGLGDDMSQADVIGAMVSHCEEFRRFAIVDPPPLLSDTELADWRQRTVSSVQAAVYAPYLKIINLDAASPKRVVDVPPSGFVAGVFGRTDRDRGVHKAPANERVRGIVGLAVDYTQRQQDLLNPSSVNLIRAFQGRGIRIWGARNATDDVQWRYVNVRRLFNLIETSVERSTQWVVFEPNTTSTWLRIRVSVENFLEQLWRSGALAGTSPEEAYRVRVGLGETMTETDIDLGLVVTEVAVAPAKPAEFVVFRFSHKRITE